MDILHSDTSKEFYNELLPMNQIIKAYKQKEMPNTFCLLWNHEQAATFVAAENNDLILQQNRKGMILDGFSAVPVYESFTT